MPHYCFYDVFLTGQYSFQQILGKDIHKSHPNYKANCIYPYSICKEWLLCKLIQCVDFPPNNIIMIINKLVIWLRVLISSLIHYPVFLFLNNNISKKKSKHWERKVTMIIKKQEQEELNTHPWRYECKSFIIDSISLLHISFSYTIQQVDDSRIFIIIQTTANNR